MISIFEVKNNEVLSKDFEVIGSDIYSEQSRKFLKELDSAMKLYKLDYEQCREAARLFKTGNFRGALEKIWGKSKINTVQLHSEGGATEIYVYEVSGYGSFRETIVRKGMTQYKHTITAKYSDNPTPSHPLAVVIDVETKGNERDQEIALKDAFAGRSTADIYNILFVCMDGYDMSKVLSKYHLKLRTRL
jgi:hypothetical protein